jgi:hypothetical protein
MTDVSRRVIMLETDERAGLVASLAAACAAQNVSLEIATGPGHVLISFDASEESVGALVPALTAVTGVIGLYSYSVKTS